MKHTYERITEGARNDKAIIEAFDLHAIAPDSNRNITGSAFPMARTRLHGPRNRFVHD